MGGKQNVSWVKAEKGCGQKKKKKKGRTEKEQFPSHEVLGQLVSKARN